MTTTYSDVEAEISLFSKQLGYRPNLYYITATQFIEVLQDVYSSRRGTLPGTMVPEFDKIDFGHTEVRVADSTGTTLYTWMNILAEYGRQYAIHNPTSHLGGLLQLDIGPWGYAAPLPPRSFSASSPLHPHNAVHHTEEQSPTATTQKAGEPACLCSSRTLVTVGHEQGCRWLLWRRSNG